MANHATRVYEDVIEMLPDEANPSPLVRVNRLNPHRGFCAVRQARMDEPLRVGQGPRGLGNGAGPRGAGRAGRRPRASSSRPRATPASASRPSRRPAATAMRAVVPERVPGREESAAAHRGADVEVLSDDLCPCPGPRGRHRSTWPRPTPRPSGTALSCPTSTRTRRTSRPTCGRRARRSGGRRRAGDPPVLSRWAPAARSWASRGSSRSRNPQVQGSSPFSRPRGTTSRGCATSASSRSPGSSTRPDRRDPRDRLRAGLHARPRPGPPRRALCRSELGPGAGGGAAHPRGADEPREGVGVMIFADSVFKYTSRSTSELRGHIPDDRRASDARRHLMRIRASRSSRGHRLGQGAPGRPEGAARGGRRRHAGLRRRVTSAAPSGFNWQTQLQDRVRATSSAKRISSA